MKKLLVLWIFFIIAGPAHAQQTGIFITNQNGDKTSQFSRNDEIYIEGVCPSAASVSGDISKIYITPDRTWNTNDELSDVSLGIEAISVLSDGVVARTKIWKSPLNDGAYDVVIDTNNDLVLQAYENCIIGAASTGFRVGNAPPPPPPSASSGQAPPAQTTPPPPSASSGQAPSPKPAKTFSLNDYVEVSGLSNVRKSPGGAAVGQQINSAGGYIVGGPVQADLSGKSYWFWNVDFIDDPDGWVAETTIFAEKPPAQKPTPEPEPTPAPEPEPEEIAPDEPPAEENTKTSPTAPINDSERAQISDTKSSLDMNSIAGAGVIGVAIILGFVLGSAIIARALKREY